MLTSCPSALQQWTYKLTPVQFPCHLMQYLNTVFKKENPSTKNIYKDNQRQKQISYARAYRHGVPKYCIQKIIIQEPKTILKTKRDKNKYHMHGLTVMLLGGPCQQACPLVNFMTVLSSVKPAQVPRLVFPPPSF